MPVTSHGHEFAGRPRSRLIRVHFVTLPSPNLRHARTCCGHPMRCPLLTSDASVHPHLLGQILPVGIAPSTCYFPGARPALDGVSRRIASVQFELREIDQAMGFVAACKHGARLLVLIDTSARVACHAECRAYRACGSPECRRTRAWPFCRRSLDGEFCSHCHGRACSRSCSGARPSNPTIRQRRGKGIRTPCNKCGHDGWQVTCQQ